jgi:hypothetical protein
VLSVDRVITARLLRTTQSPGISDGKRGSEQERAPLRRALFGVPSIADVNESGATRAKEIPLDIDIVVQIACNHGA